jgi:hypothetical protein
MIKQMAEINSHTDDFINTDIFVVVENEGSRYDFVTIDEDASFDAVVIDISQDELMDAIVVDFETDSGDFVQIDEDQVFISDFSENDMILIK